MGKYKLYDFEHDKAYEFDLTPSQFGELKGFLRALKKPPQMDYKLVLEHFNATCRNLPPATRLTDKRKRAIARLQKEQINLDELFAKAAESTFLGGKNLQKWRASLDWLLIPSNAVKVLEGNYAPLLPIAAIAPMTGNPFEEYE